MSSSEEEILAIVTAIIKKIKADPLQYVLPFDTADASLDAYRAGLGKIISPLNQQLVKRGSDVGRYPEIMQAIQERERVLIFEVIKNGLAQAMKRGLKALVLQPQVTFEAIDEENARLRLAIKAKEEDIYVKWRLKYPNEFEIFPTEYHVHTIGIVQNCLDGNDRRATAYKTFFLIRESGLYQPLVELKKKVADLHKKYGENAPATVAARVLYKRIFILGGKVFSNQLTVAEFRRQSKESINAARPVLSQHRGCKLLLADLLNACLTLLSLGSTYLITGRLRLFHPPTDSIKKVDSFQESIDAIPDEHLSRK